MPIYEKPTKALMQEFAKENLVPGKLFSKKEAIAFAKHYPKLRPTTIDMHVNGMSVNNRVRKHHRSIKPGSGYDLFYKVGPDQFRLWDAQRDEAPFYASSLQASTEGAEAPSEYDEDGENLSDVGSSEFALEADLRNYICGNPVVIETGLKLYEEEGITGIEFPADGRRIDVLCVDREGSFVVIELKVSRGYDRVVGQILRYMAWVKQHLANGSRVRGIIIASEISDDLRLAASLIQDVSLIEYEISFQLKRVS